MTKTVFYTYLGTNGTLVTPIHLPGVYSVKSYRLDAGKDKKLTSDGETFVQSVTVNQTEVDNWYEVDA